MIHSVKAENFRSINGSVELSFIVDKRFSKSTRNIISGSGTQLSLAEAIIGPNASGKTNLLNALVSIKWLITDSLKARYPLDMAFSGFAGNKDSSPIKLSVTFEDQGVLYDYSVSIAENRIIAERLDTKDKTSVRSTKKLLFERTLQGNKKYSIKSRGGFFQSHFDRMSYRDLKGVSLLSVGAFYGDEKPKALIEYWDRLETNIDPTPRFAPPGYEAHMALRRMAKSKAQLEPFEMFDKSIGGFNKSKGTFRHRYGDGYFDLEVDQESSGTQQYIVTIEKLNSVLKNGGIAVIDEFDAYLHPLMFSGLINQFFDSKKNHHGAQLLFSTHSLQILSSLEQYQIVLVDKINSVTRITRLDQNKSVKVRSDDNYYLRYIRGEYGALPPHM